MRTYYLSRVISIAFIVSFIFANVGDAFASKYWGAWETKKGAKPSIKIEIKKNKQTKVIIDGKERPMKYSYNVGEQNHPLLEFGQNIVYKSGNETDVEIYLIGGSIGNDFVLTGFYFYTDYDQEGVEKNVVMVPITLYLIKCKNQPLAGQSASLRSS